jgi:hypothetical protein
MSAPQDRPQWPAPQGWRRILALPGDLVDFDRRGFRTRAASTRATLEGDATAFLFGFNTELGVAPDAAPDLDGVPAHQRGFAAEGAAMAGALLDLLNPFGGGRLATLHRVHGPRHAYLLHVGTGWAMAKLRRHRLGRLGAGSPLLRWLAFDGMGFCQAFFRTERGMRRWYRHPARCTAVCDIRYQGLGRSLWFRDCGSPDALAARLQWVPPRHRADVWSGIGLAATYAGGVPATAYPELCRHAGTHRAALAQGAAFGAQAWRRCEHLPAHARDAVPALTGVDVEVAAEWTDQARHGLDRPGASSADYGRWRRRVQQRAAQTINR